MAAGNVSLLGNLIRFFLYVFHFARDYSFCPFRLFCGANHLMVRPQNVKESSRQLRLPGNTGQLAVAVVAHTLPPPPRLLGWEGTPTATQGGSGGYGSHEVPSFHIPLLTIISAKSFRRKSRMKWFCKGRIFMSAFAKWRGKIPAEGWMRTRSNRNPTSIPNPSEDVRMQPVKLAQKTSH